MVLNSKYTAIREWVETLPEIFSTTGEVIYDARNQIRVIVGPDGQAYCVKRYHRPSLPNRIAYTFFRTPKGKRAYEYALRLTQLGIATPEPVAYIEMREDGLIGESYLVTVMSRLGHRLYEVGQQNVDMDDRESLLRALARRTAEMHEKGVMHLDYSPGNILFDRVDGEWMFEIVDINRMHFGTVSPEQGCGNFARLWGNTAMFLTLSDEYARARNMDKEKVRRLVLEARREFWKNKHPHPDQYRE